MTHTKRNECLRKMDSHFRADVNCVKFSKANTIEHELAKAAVALEILRRDNEFVTEARFADGTRADIFDITSDEVYEVESIITIDSAAKKRALYDVAHVWIIDPKKNITKQM